MPLTKSRILIIDDQPDSVALLLAYFQDQGWEIMVALNGLDGIQKATNGKPDLILLDVCMPKLGGFAVCQQLKLESSTAHIPVIFLSANISIASRLEGFSAGGLDYIGKPFSADEVLARIYAHLKIKKRLDQLESEVAKNANQPHSIMLNSSSDGELIAIAVSQFKDDKFSWCGMEKLSRQLGVGEKKLTELFRAQFDMTVYEYYLEVMLDKACIKLAKSNIQIQLIANAAGYCNASDFSRAFRRRYGVSPRQYRQAKASSDEIGSHTAGGMNAIS